MFYLDLDRTLFYLDLDRTLFYLKLDGTLALTACRPKCKMLSFNKLAPFISTLPNHDCKLLLLILWNIKIFWVKACAPPPPHPKYIYVMVLKYIMKVGKKKMLEKPKETKGKVAASGGYKRKKKKQTWQKIGQ